MNIWPVVSCQCLYLKNRALMNKVRDIKSAPMIVKTLPVISEIRPNEIRMKNPNSVYCFSAFLIGAASAFSFSITVAAGTVNEQVGQTSARSGYRSFRNFAARIGRVDI